MKETDFILHSYKFISSLKDFEYTLDIRDRIWNIIFPDQNDQWYHLHIRQYEDTYYLSHINGNSCSLEIVPDESFKPAQSFGFSSREEGFYNPEEIWEPIIEAASKWLSKIRKNWISLNKLVQENYPLIYRKGIVQNSLIRYSLPDIYRLDVELGKDDCSKMIELAESNYFSRNENFMVPSFSAVRFFEYCKIAYIASARGDESVDNTLNGRDMYKLFADNRHEGLLDINENSEEEFAEWIDGTHPAKSGGGHPWEIKRGGNTTHINLAVYRPYLSKSGFIIELQGASIGRLAETIKMFLAIHEAGLPITISDADSVRQRLLAQDNIGIIPEYQSLHRANQLFPKEQKVSDVLYYKDLGRYKRRITPFIRWNLLPILKPV